MLLGTTPALANSGDTFALPPASAPASAYGPTVRTTNGHPNPDDLAGIAERQRERGNLSAALLLSQRVRAFAPDNVQAIQTEVSTLSNLGAANRALTLAKLHAAIFPAGVLERLRVDKTAADIRQALADRKRLDRRQAFADRNRSLQAVLVELDEDLSHFEKGSPAYLRTQGNRVEVLQELGDNQAATDAYRDLEQQNTPVPQYVLRATAAAESGLHHPRRAATLYRAIIKTNPDIDVDVYISLYYALIDGECYRSAERVLEKIHARTPVWIYPAGSHTARQPNWERVDVDQLWALDASYRQHNATAQVRSKRLYDRAPANVSLINTYASILRWRGWPLASQNITDRAAAYAPNDLATRINVAENARELENFARWRRTIVPLKQEFPDNSIVVDSYAALQDRRRASMSSELTVGSSHGGNAVQGDRDRQLMSRVNSPWSPQGWRAYASQDYRWSDYDEGAGSFNRAGIGAERSWDRRHLWGELSDDRFSGKHVGVQLGFSQWLGDHWQYRVLTDSYSTQTPLRAERAGLRGRLLDTQVTWRGSESRSAYLEGNVLAITDGNRRVSFSAGLSQSIQASAHHLTSASLLLDSTHDTRPGGAYFNPANMRSQGLQLEHQWITWRRYDQSLTQDFTLSASSEWQSGYGSRQGFEIQYGNNWQLSRTWALSYGVNWGSHVYDGSREHRVTGTVSLSGVF